ncbi:MAG: tyrosine-type recombinase/integrase [Sarcina sp.]
MDIKSIFVRKKHNKYCVIAKYLDIDKKIKQKQLNSFDKLKDANSYLIEEKSKLNKNLFILPTKTTLIEYLNTWNDLRKNNLSIRTYTYYKELIANRISNYLTNTTLNNITPLQIELFYQELNKSLTKNGVVKYHRLLNKALGDAKKKRLIEFNPCEFVEVPRQETSEKASYLTFEETQELLKLSVATRYELPIHLAIILGLRASEILGLSWNKIDFKKKTICIDKVTVKNRITKEVEFKAPKTKKSIRTIHIPNFFLKRLEDNYKRFRLLKLQGIPNKYNLVFCKVNGEPMDSSVLSKGFNSFLKKHDFRIIRFHDLRHTNASLQLKAGTSLKVTSEQLGHSTINITADLYTHVLDELKIEAASNMDKLFNS